MSCSSLKNRFDQLKAGDHLNFDAAMNLYNDLKGSIDAHRIELSELQKSENEEQIQQLKEHIHDGETMLNELKSMTLH
jgi:hypothetical protein